MPRLEINRDTCMRSGQCYVVQPRLLQPDDEDIPVPTQREFPEEERVPMQEAANVCPTGSITVAD